MKVYAHPPGESWIVDRMVNEWREHNQDISTLKPQEADIIWIMADWTYNHFSLEFLKSKKVLTTCHHVIPEHQSGEFMAKDSITDLYHAICNHTNNDLISAGATKPIVTELMWVNNKMWYSFEDKSECREKFGFSDNDFVIGSFQRDTEGSDLISPKLIKGPDIFCDYVEKVRGGWEKKGFTVKVLLGAWRRQYVMSRLDKAGIPYVYKELSDEKTLNEMYNALDLYVVGSRIEGGPQSIYECAATYTPIISTDVGIASAILPPQSIAKYFSANSLLKCKPRHPCLAFEKVRECFIEYSMPKFRKILEKLNEQ